MTPPTAALVEEAEREIAHMKAEALSAENPHSENTIRLTLIIDLVAALRRTEAEREEARSDIQRAELARWQAEHKRDLAIAERDELRATVTRLNRRAQTAEAGVLDNVEASKAAGKSMGRTLANAAADMYLRRAEKAEAELDEARAQVWGLGCKVTNLRNALKRNEQQRRELGWRAASEEATMAEVVRLRFQSLHWFEENERHSKQMRDCLRQKFELTQENARLQAQVATLELLLRGGK